MALETHLKKRVAIVVEAPILQRVLDALDRLNVSGYTVYPVVAGRGRGGAWREDGLVGDAGRMVSVVCVVDPSNADAVIETVYAVVARQIGIVTVSDVQVIRRDRF